MLQTILPGIVMPQNLNGFDGTEVTGTRCQRRRGRQNLHHIFNA
jgi:hypothetical protein